VTLSATVPGIWPSEYDGATCTGIDLRQDLQARPGGRRRIHGGRDHGLPGSVIDGTFGPGTRRPSTTSTGAPPERSGAAARASRARQTGHRRRRRPATHLGDLRSSSASTELRAATRTATHSPTSGTSGTARRPRRRRPRRTPTRRRAPSPRPCAWTTAAAGWTTSVRIDAGNTRPRRRSRTRPRATGSSGADHARRLCHGPEDGALPQRRSPGR
jgi:hypothetical protein